MIAKALTEFMIDLAAAMARDDYETRRKRQAQDIEKAKTSGKYLERQPVHELEKTFSYYSMKGKAAHRYKACLNAVVWPLLKRSSWVSLGSNNSFLQMLAVVL